MTELTKATNRYHKSMLALGVTFLVISLVCLTGLVLAYANKNSELSAKVTYLQSLLEMNRPTLDKIDAAVAEIKTDNANQTRLLCKLILNNGIGSDELCQGYIQQYQSALSEPSFTQLQSSTVVQLPPAQPDTTQNDSSAPLLEVKPSPLPCIKTGVLEICP